MGEHGRVKVILDTENAIVKLEVQAHLNDDKLAQMTEEKRRHKIDK